MKKLIYFLGFSLFIVLATSFSSKFTPNFAIKTVVIDAGHGGKDPGCHGKKYQEKDVALAVALKLGKYIEENIKDVKVVYTRKTDVFLELQERANIANRAKADLFICIHCNSACYRDKKAKKDICKDYIHGAETYVMGIKNEQGKLDVAKRENSAILLEDDYVQKYEGFDPNSDESYIIMSMFTDTYLNNSLNFAAKLQKEYSTKAGRHDKGVKRASLWVLWRTYMPSVLTEIGYLTNPEEEAFLGSTEGQDYIASGIFRAFRSYKDEIDGDIKKYEDAFEKQEAYKPIETKINQEDEKEEQEEEKTEETKIEKPIAPDEALNKPVEEKITPKEENQPKEVVIEKIVEKKEVPVISSAIVYKVQIMTSDKKLDLESEIFKNIEKPGEYLDKGVYKYTSGEFENQSDASVLMKKMRENGFKDAFVIMMKDGKRILSK